MLIDDKMMITGHYIPRHVQMLTDGDVAGDEEAGAFLTLSRVTFPNHHLLLLVLVHSGFYLPGLSSEW